MSYSPRGCRRVGHDLVAKKQLSISCNLLSTVLKVKKTELLSDCKVVVSVLVVYPHDYVAEWEL